MADVSDSVGVYSRVVSLGRRLSVVKDSEIAAFVEVLSVENVVEEATSSVLLSNMSVSEVDASSVA